MTYRDTCRANWLARRFVNLIIRQNKRLWFIDTQSTYEPMTIEEKGDKDIYIIIMKKSIKI